MRQIFKEGFVTPQPVFIIATYDENGRPNAMNAAWAGQVGNDIISVTLSSHKTTDNIRLNREFTVSFATKEQAPACDYVGIVSGNDIPDKLEKCGFTTVKAPDVNAPIIEQLPVAIECRVIEMQEEFGDIRVVAQIVGMSADDSVLTDGKVDLGKLEPIMFDSAALTYRVIGDNVGGAWNIGKSIS